MADHKIDSFGKERAKAYDQSNSFMAPIYENLHYLITVILSELVPHSKILCVGVGTGTEIIKLAEAFPSRVSRLRLWILQSPCSRFVVNDCKS